MSAEERRASVVNAAMREFAVSGYHGTSTEAIAHRVGVSQPYLFRLFPGGKKAIFLAAAVRCIDDTAQLFVDAAGELSGEQAFTAMADVYNTAITERPDRLLMQMQIYAAMAAAGADGDDEFGDEIRTHWLRLWDSVRDALGADTEETTTFMAYGMLINCLVALGYPPEERVWRGMYPETRRTQPTLRRRTDTDG